MRKNVEKLLSNIHNVKIEWAWLEQATAESEARLKELKKKLGIKEKRKKISIQQDLRDAVNEKEKEPDSDIDKLMCKENKMKNETNLLLMMKKNTKTTIYLILLN